MTADTSTAYVILYGLIDTGVLDSNRRVGVWSLSWHWHILSIPLTRNLWVRWCVSSWRPLFPSRSSVLIYICIFYMSSVFFNFTSCVLLSDDNSLTPGCLWLLAFVLNNTLILGILCSTISHLPGCFFVPGLSFRISDSTRCHQTPLCHIWLLNLDILNGSFRLCNWLSLRRLVSWINHLPPACWSTFWKSILGL